MYIYRINVSIYIYMAHKSTFFQYDWSMHYLYILPSVCTLSDRFYRFWTVEKLHTCNKHLLKSLIILQCLCHFHLFFLVPIVHIQDMVGCCSNGLITMILQRLKLSHSLTLFLKYVFSIWGHSDGHFTQCQS